MNFIYSFRDNPNMIFFYIMKQFNKKIKIKMCQNIANILTRIAYFVVNFKRIKQ